jgi:hypothetical protein
MWAVSFSTSGFVPHQRYLPREVTESVPLCQKSRWLKENRPWQVYNADLYFYIFFYRLCGCCHHQSLALRKVTADVLQRENCGAAFINHALCEGCEFVRAMLFITVVYWARRRQSFFIGHLTRTENTRAVTVKWFFVFVRSSEDLLTELINCILLHLNLNFVS